MTYVADTTQVKTQTDLAGRVTTFHYDGIGRVIEQEIDDHGTVTHVYRDHDDALAGGGSRESSYVGAPQTPNADGKVVRTYNRIGMLKQWEIPGQSPLTLLYDVAGRLTNRGGVNYTYKSTGQLDVVSGNGGVAQFGYDTTGRLSTVDLPHGLRRAFTYDDADRLASLTNTMGVTDSESWSSIYDNQGRMDSISHQNNGVSLSQTQYSYRNGRLIGEERGGDAAVNATYGYDENGNRSTVIRYASPQSKSEDFSHVATALLPSLDSGWQVADGLLSANLPTAGGTVALALTSGTDVHGPLLSVQVNPLLANGATGFVAAGLRLTLDATTAYRAQWSRQWSSDFAQVRQGQVVLEKVTTSGGVSTVTVLAMSLLQTETTVSPVTISVMRGADGLLTVTAANATVGTITLEATVASSPDDVAPSAVSLEVTASGNSAANTTYDHISWTTSPSRTVRRNDYDGLDRLMAHAEVNDVGVTTAGTTYGRDALGRLMNRTAAGGSVTASYAYDALDRQHSITEGGITTISAYIGSEWMRRSTTPSVGAPTTWTYDDQGITSRVSGTNTTTYQRHGGSLLWENGTTNGASSTNSYALDLHGNVTGIAGTITNGQRTMDAYRQRFDYDAWGQIVRERYGQVDQNNQPNYYPVSTISSGPRYRGMWYDGGAKGVYKTETRLYDPELGQFLQEDPARKKENWFSYAGSDPVNRKTQQAWIGFIRFPRMGMVTWFGETKVMEPNQKTILGGSLALIRQIASVTFKQHQLSKRVLRQS